VSDDPTPAASSANAWANPQVLIALITGIVTVLAAFIGILPTLIEANQPTPTPTPTHTPTPTLTLTSTPAPPPTEAFTLTLAPTLTPVSDSPTDVPASEPTSAPTSVPPTLEPTTAPTSAPTSAPTDAPPAAPTASNPPNALLIYDDASFTLVNVSGRNLSLAGVRFRGGGVAFNSTGWANNTRIPDGNCVRLRDTAAGQRNPPGECGALLSLLLLDRDALFWIGTDSFEVVRRGVVLATCATDTDRCAIYIPQE
jgi:hypothetical protein